MRAIAFAILFVGIAQVVAHKNNGGMAASGWNLAALASMAGAIVCIIGGW